MFSKRITDLRPTSSRRLFAPVFLKRADRVGNEAIIRGLCANAYLGDDTSLCRVLGRYKMFVDTRDIGLSVHLMLDGYWEMWLTEVLASVLRPGMKVVDVGANLGYFSVLMADMVGRQGSVHAFEPNAALAGRLKKTAMANGFDRFLHVHQTALGDEEGARFRMLVPDSDPKNGFIVPAHDTDVDQADIVVTRRLDGFAELLDADVVKIDADTAERAIWRGMEGIFDRGRPMTVFLEFNAERYDDPAAFVAEILKPGFSISRITLEDGPIPCSVADILSFTPAEDQILMMRR